MDRMRLCSVAFFLNCALFSVPASATLLFQGDFLQDDQRATFSFTVVSPGAVLFQTLGYAGGTVGPDIVPAGGFDPVLSLFDSTGSLIALNNDDPGAAIDPVTGIGLDSLLSLSLAAGNYTLVLTESDNVTVGPDLAAGFTRTGQGNFTGPVFIGGPGAFWDSSPTQRNNLWALAVDGVEQSATVVPEPNTILTLSSGILGIVFFRRRSLVRRKR